MINGQASFRYGMGLSVQERSFMEQNKGAQRAAWFAGQAVNAATNPKLFIVKVLVTILAVLIGFLFVVGSLFGVIFSQLGFSNSADYTSEMF